MSVVTDPTTLQLPIGYNPLPKDPSQNNQSRLTWTSSSADGILPDLSLNYAYAVTDTTNGDISSSNYVNIDYDPSSSIFTLIKTGNSLLRTNAKAIGTAGAYTPAPVVRFACQAGYWGGAYEGGQGSLVPDGPTDGAGNVPKGDMRGFALIGVGYNADPSANDYVSMVLDTSAAGVLIQTVGKYWLVEQNFNFNTFFPQTRFQVENAGQPTSPLLPILPFDASSSTYDVTENPYGSGSGNRSYLYNNYKSDPSGNVPGPYNILFQNTFNQIAPTSCAMNRQGNTFVSYGYYVDPSSGSVLSPNSKVYRYDNSGSADYTTAPNTITESTSPIIDFSGGNITSIVIGLGSNTNQHLYALDISNNNIYSVDLGTDGQGTGVAINDPSTNIWTSLGAPPNGQWRKICVNPAFSPTSIPSTLNRPFLYLTSPGDYYQGLPVDPAAQLPKPALESAGNGIVQGLVASSAYAYVSSFNILGDTSNNTLYRPGNIAVADNGAMIVMIDMFNGNAGISSDSNFGPVIPGNMYRFIPPAGTAFYNKNPDGSGNSRQLTYYDNNLSPTPNNSEAGYMFDGAPVWMPNHKSTFLIPYYFNLAAGGQITGPPIDPGDGDPDPGGPPSPDGPFLSTASRSVFSVGTIGATAPNLMTNASRIQTDIISSLDFCTPFVYDLSYGVISDASYAMCPVVNNPTTNSLGANPKYSLTGSTTKTQYLNTYKWTFDDLNGTSTFFVNNGFDASFNVTVECMRKGTMISCFDNNRDCEVPIEDVKEGMLIKTNGKGYKKVTYVRSTDMNNIISFNHINGLYRMSKEKHPYLTEDLYLTGGHSILLDELTEAEHTKMHSINWPNHFYEVYDKKKLLVMHSEMFELVSDRDMIYNLVLEQDDEEDEFYCYGIYANGLLIESCNKGSLGVEHLKDNTKMFQDVTSGRSTNFYTPQHV